MAGTAAGLLAGALEAFGYVPLCKDLGMSFVALWYALGIAVVALLGALLGPRLLR